MRDERRRRTETLFDACRTRSAGPERQAFLEGACGDDHELLARVEALLGAHDEANAALQGEGFLEAPAVSGSLEGPGSSIGAYKLLQEIGEGGMGVVYMAEQERPVRRKVALKVIKLGMDTKQVIARFEAERQALAMMDHAHIARVLDAGATETGRPYFVMELVRGVPINEYCDTHKLSTGARLGLFIEVCGAVQHAHQKGIIHRDLKPTNVLVTSHDGKPVPKIIDFGVAKATNQRLTERTLFTEFHQIIGTPEYMSPEQAEMSGLDVDTRSDIYSLGVLLYQLLTGTTPVDAQDLRTAGHQEMTRMIREDEPQTPSTRVSKLGAGADEIANHRRSDASSLSRHLRGDLDWIVMRALEKDRTRRYQNASALAEDIERHLENRPVEAGPPGALYRLAKFARRNRKAVVAGLGLVAVVGLGLAGTTAGFLRARAEADRSGRIGDSLQDVLAMTDPARAADRGDIERVLVTVREVFGEQHATYAAVLSTLAVQRHDAGDFEAAVELGRESLAVWRAVYGEQHSNVAIALARLGRSLRARGDDQQAEAALRAALEIDAENTETLGPAGYEVRVALADQLSTRGDYEEADQLLGEALAFLRASPSPPHFRIIETLEARAAVQVNWSGGDLLQTLREVYEETHEFYPDDSPMLAMAALGYGRKLFEQGEFETGEPYLREAIRRFGEASSPSVYFVLAGDTLFQVLRGRDDPESLREADDLLRDMIAVARSFWSVDDLAGNLRYYAKRLTARGRTVDAFRAALEGYETLVNAQRPADQRDSLRGNMMELVFKLCVQPELDPAVLARAEVAAELALADDPENPFLSAAMGAVRYRLGEFELAATILSEAQAEFEAALPARVSRKLSPVIHAFLGLSLARLGDETGARAELEALRAELGGEGNGEPGAAIAEELEALIDAEPSPTTGG